MQFSCGNSNENWYTWCFWAPDKVLPWQQHLVLKPIQMEESKTSKILYSQFSSNVTFIESSTRDNMNDVEVFMYKSVKLDVLGRQNKMWAFAKAFLILVTCQSGTMGVLITFSDIACLCKANEWGFADYVAWKSIPMKLFQHLTVNHNEGS